MSIITYWLSRNGTDTEGPFTESQIKGLFDRAEITASAQVCMNGKEQWYPVSDLLATITPEKSHAVYAVLGLFLGMFGAHNFYAGESERAAYKLVSTIIALIMLGALAGLAWVVLTITAVIVLIEVVKGPIPAPSVSREPEPEMELKGPSKLLSAIAIVIVVLLYVYVLFLLFAAL